MLKNEGIALFHGHIVKLKIKKATEAERVISHNGEGLLSNYKSVFD